MCGHTFVCLSSAPFTTDVMSKRLEQRLPRGRHPLALRETAGARAVRTQSVRSAFAHSSARHTNGRSNTSFGRRRRRHLLFGRVGRDPRRSMSLRRDFHPGSLRPACPRGVPDHEVVSGILCSSPYPGALDCPSVLRLPALLHPFDLM